MRYLLPLIFLVVSLPARAQHNADLLQYMFSGLLMNPAYAGSNDALDLTSLYRKQWMGFDGAPVTTAFTAHSPLRGRKNNLGLQLVNDVLGVYNYKKVAVSYAYSIDMDKSRLSFGLQGGINHYVTDWNRLRLIHNNDPGFIPETQRRVSPSAGAGVYFRNRILYLGLGAPELLDFGSQNQRTVIAHAGFLAPLVTDITLKPALLIKYIQGSPVFANLSATAYYKEVIGLGFGYTANTSAIALIDLRLNEQLRFGYGYEYSVNQLRYVNSGSHEIMLRYIFNFKIESANARYF